jgi:segregation and condensation protein A
VPLAWLTLLRTRLLFPDLRDEAAQAEAAGLRQRLTNRDAARRLADWLERRPQLGRVPDALAQMRRLLAALPQGAALEAFLPAAAGQGPTARVQRQAALASTLVAGLELSRDGTAVLNQDAAFGGIVVRPGAADGAPAARDAAA